ncbi:MAG: DUF5312 domain-containing protein [Treponema sp.]|nr:DUF5312 domain-containing protein [Treponema sp.]
MGLFQTITDFFDSIFRRSSPEVQRKQLLKKLDAEIKLYNPQIFKDGNLQPNFAEAIFSLYKNTKPLENLFAMTVNPNDVPKQHRFEAQLIVTGYSPSQQEDLARISYQNRKEEVLEETNNPDRIYLRHRKILEGLIKELNTDSFKRMDKDILDLRQLVEFCRYNFVQFMQVFDGNFIPADLSYKPYYMEVPVQKAINLLEDLYYQLEGLKITKTMASEIIALANLANGSELPPSESERYVSSLKKINYVITKVISADKLKQLIRYAKENGEYEPNVAVYSGSPRQEFATMLQEKFDVDEKRMKSEIQDERITLELENLFHDIPLDEVTSYNAASNAMLQQSTSFSFTWILPMRILKTFLHYFFPSSIYSLLNDIVIEGFFNNPDFKSSFSSMVYSAISSSEFLKDFEDSFGNDKKNSIAVLQSYMLDSHKDKDFYKRLERMVYTINDDAHRLLQDVTTNLHLLYKQLGELLADAKKPSSEIIQNLKVLMFSSRNRENTNLIEEYYPQWKIFFEIMKNYVIINSTEKKS